jgi:DNA-binding NtrC family response regulator
MHLEIFTALEGADFLLARDDERQREQRADAKAQAITEFERRYLSAVLQRAGGNLSLAARIAGKERSLFCKLVRKYGLQRAAFGILTD